MRQDGNINFVYLLRFSVSCVRRILYWMKRTLCTVNWKVWVKTWSLMNFRPAFSRGNAKRRSEIGNQSSSQKPSAKAQDLAASCGVNNTYTELN